MSNSDKTVVVTGGSGFIGTVICKQLVEQGYTVVNIDKKKKEIEGVTLYPFDLASTQIEGIIKILQPDTIIHMAAEHEVARSVLEPHVYYHNNVVNTINLLGYAIQYGVKNFIFSSSSTVYGNTTVFPTPETMPMDPINPYGRSKSIIETVLSDYSKTYGINTATLRYFNAAGAMPDNSHGYVQDPASHLVPIVAKKLANGEKISVYGNDYDTTDGTCERDYTHVCDLSSAHIAAMQYLEGKESTHEIFNIGQGLPNSVLGVIQMFEKVTGLEPDFEVVGRRAGDAARTYADISKAKELLGWEPKYNLRDMVEHAWAWETKKKRKK